MLRSSQSTCAMVLASILLSACCSKCPRGEQPKHPWPIEVAPGGRALGNTLGEFQGYGDTYQHAGIDVFAQPRDSANPAEEAPWVVAVTIGDIVCKDYGPTSLTNECTVKGTNGLTYRYLHLSLGSNEPNSEISVHNVGSVSPGDRIAQVTKFNPGEFSHLHYEMSCDKKYINPLRDIEQHSDAERPVIESLAFAVDRSDQNGGPWDEFGNVPQNGIGGLECTSDMKMVKGLIDILVKFRDHDGDGSTVLCAIESTVGIYKLVWKVCSVSTGQCEEKTGHTFDELPIEWAEMPGNESSLAQYSVTSNWKSQFGYCTKDTFVSIPTNMVNGKPSALGAWQTTMLSDGQYMVRVEITDFGGNVTPKEEKVCVNNHH